MHDRFKNLQIQNYYCLIIILCSELIGIGVGVAVGYAYSIKRRWVYPLFMAAISVFLCACCDSLAACIWGALFAAITLFFATKDVLCREVSDWMHVLIFLLGCFWLRSGTWKSMIAGALVCGLPMLIAALIKSGSVGGADIKCMAAIGWALGLEKGVMTLILGCLLSVIGAIAVACVRRHKIQSLPMVPFFCASALLVFGIL